MLLHKIPDLSKHLNKLTCNKIILVEDLGLCYGEVYFEFGNLRKSIFCIIEKGNELTISLNIINKLFENIFINEVTISINTNDMKPLTQLSVISKICLRPISNLYSDSIDFSKSIFEYFSKDCYLTVNDIIKIPINYHDFSQLLNQNNSHFIYQDHFFVNILSISSIETTDCPIYYFDHKISSLSLKPNDILYKRIFDAGFKFQIDFVVLDNFLKVLIPAVRAFECATLLKMIGQPFIHVFGPAFSGKGTLIWNVANSFGHRYIALRASELIGQTLSAMEKKFDKIISLVEKGNYLSIHFEDFDSFFLTENEIMDGKYDSRTIRVFTKLLESLSKVTNKEILLFISTKGDIPFEINRYVLIHYDAGPTSDCERRAIVKDYVNDINDIVEDLVKLSTRTPRVELISALRAVTSSTVHDRKEIVDVFKSIAVSGGDKDSTTIDSVSWKDIGGLGEIIREVLATIRLILSEHKPVPGYTVRKSGILLHGEPGTGKTLLAKAVASECNLNFVSVKGPELLNMYVGQTEANVRSLFVRVKRMVPCLLFCDELDSIVPRRGFSGDSGGVMDRVVSQFALEMDAINGEDNQRIVVMAATNRPDLIDPALLRNGRFDTLFHIGGGGTRADQLEILRSQTYKVRLEASVDLEEVVDRFPGGGMTGAKIYGLVSEAVMNAIRRVVTGIEAGLEESTCEIEVSMDDFVSALA